MNKKNIVLRPPIKTKYAYEKLRCCNKCHNYTALQEENCSICGKSALLPMLEVAKRAAKRSMGNDLLLTLLLTLLSIIFSPTLQWVIISAITGAVLLVVFVIVHRIALPSRTSIELSKIFVRDRDRIAEGLLRNLDTAVAQENEARSYELMREIAAIIHDDHIRKLQIILLQSLKLRKDMELELEPLLVKDFDPELADYIGELAKIKRELIKDHTFQYVIKYEAKISVMEHGDDILTGVAGAAVRMKRYVLAYADFISRHARKLPKDRFLRLYRIVMENPNLNWGALKAETVRVYEEKYQWDADFQQIKSRSNIHDV
ncbi:hypothetical protein [Paenibacillus aceti]|uniref:Uncharacterized protein n=1 Tax=Paenibacillus aceti TaxID=1820010 RepID=A0ABQ1VVL4_9BACL|nr:hypothetical protein [Paenibacillus aceti]GGG01520.1 hypothetical protein GCM10010913_24050 [Paenibacillus aceti]